MGDEVGQEVGYTVGARVGCPAVGRRDGECVGARVGFRDGGAVGARVGRAEGLSVGVAVCPKTTEKELLEEDGENGEDESERKRIKDRPRM